MTLQWLDHAGCVLVASSGPQADLDATDLLQRLLADLHPGQAAFVTDQQTEILGVSAGYGAGKTRALCAKAVSLAIANQGFIGCVMEPTGPLIRDIWQNDFEDFLEAYSIPYSFRASPLPEYVLHLPGGDTKILCRSFENWTRIIGLNLAWVLADEIDTVAPTIAAKAFPKILGRLRSGNVRQFGAASTPEGFRWMYSTFGSQEAQERSDRRLIKMRTVDNPHLPPDFIERLQANYDPSLLRAYLDGEFVNLTTGQVYDRFNRAVHVVPCDWDELEAETILLGVDFNVGNTNGALAVRRGRELHVFDEVAGAHDTDALAQEVRRRYPHARILGYPDASGTARSTNSSRSDVAILQSYDISNMAPKANPPVRDRVASVQALLENGNGERRLFIDPRCRKLIECLELQSYNDKGEPSKDEGYDHMCFAASTKVATPSGPVAIADLPSSGWIVGPFGTPVRYENARRTGKDRPMLSVTLANGRIARCTPEHQWLTQHGWTEARHLTTRHLLLTPPSRSSRASVTTFAADTFSAMVCDFIALSGNPSMGRSLTASMFTTLMAIDQTIIPAILSCSRQAITSQSTESSEQVSTASAGGLAWENECNSWLRNGTPAMLAASGTDCITSEPRTVSMHVRELRFHARSAAFSLSSFGPVMSFAPRRARQMLDTIPALMTNSGLAQSAISHSLSTVTAKQNAALGHAALSWLGVNDVRQADPEDAYCLSSAAGSFALADGPVVSNCDALGYIVHRCFEVGRASAGKPVRGIRLY